MYRRNLEKPLIQMLISQIKILLCLILSLTFVSGSLANTISVASDPWPPYVTDNPEMPGASIEIVTSALQSQGYKVKVKYLPWARTLHTVTSGDIDLIAATWYTTDRAKYLVYSNPYLESKLHIIKRVDDDFIYSGIDSLEGKSVGIVLNYGYSDEFLNSDLFKRPTTRNLLANLYKLKAGRIDLTIGDIVASKEIMSKFNLDYSEFKFSNKLVSVSPIYVSSGKVNPNAVKYIKAFNSGLIEIITSGKYKEILDKYEIRN